jgi:hypothetical protein
MVFFDIQCNCEVKVIECLLLLHSLFLYMFPAQ